jgi:hypothetical protein
MKYHKKTRHQRNHETDSDENFKGIIRSQKKIIKRLEQRVKYLEKQLNLTDVIIDKMDDSDTKGSTSSIKNCKKCNSSDVKPVNIVKKDGELKFWVCQKCNHREKMV